MDFFPLDVSISVLDGRLVRRPAKDARRKCEPCRSPEGHSSALLSGPYDVFFRLRAVRYFTGVRRISSTGAGVPLQGMFVTKRKVPASSWNARPDCCVPP